MSEETKTVAAEAVNPAEFLATFNWHKYEEGIDEVDEAKLKEFEQALEGTVGFVNERDVIEGIVTRITDRDAIIDINSKSEGVISLNEFRYNPNLAVGDTVEVLVDKREDSSGQLVLSHKKARVIKAWDRVNNAHETGEIVNGFVKCRTRGGMIVDVFGIEAFLPGSQIDVKPIRDYDQYVEKTMEFKVVKINHEFKNVVVSHKALIEADIEEQKKEIISKLEKGQVLEGIVKNITSYGVFMDLGGVDGLIHITDLSWSRINHPSEIVELDEKLNVVILDFDENKSRIQLGLKQLSKHPWEALGEEVKVGDRVKGKVVVIADYGAFIEVAEGVEGLIHVSEMSWSTHLRSAQDFVNVGDEVEA
jgi:small subunit ribosomal protein S1